MNYQSASRHGCAKREDDDAELIALQREREDEAKKLLQQPAPLRQKQTASLEQKNRAVELELKQLQQMRVPAEAVPTGAMSAYISAASVQNSASLRPHFMAGSVSLAACDFVLEYASSVIFNPNSAQAPLLSCVQAIPAKIPELIAGTGYGGRSGQLQYDFEHCWGNLIPLSMFPKAPADATSYWEWRPQYVFPRCTDSARPLSDAAPPDVLSSDPAGDHRVLSNASPSGTIPGQKPSSHSPRDPVKPSDPVPTADIPSATVDVDSDSDHSPLAGPTVDFACTVRLRDRPFWGPIPLVMVELVNDLEHVRTRRFQLASYAINTTWIWPSNVPFIQLGIVVHSSHIGAWAFFRTADGKMCSATILEYEKIESPNAHAFINSVPDWCQRVLNLLRATEPVPWSLSPYRHMRIKDDYVYKVYDYRYRTSLPMMNRRLPDAMKAYIDGADVGEWNGMSMVRYPKFQGECFPSRLADVIAAVVAVQAFVNRNVPGSHGAMPSDSDVCVHGDIRWANIVINRDANDPDKSVAHLIDFDFSSHAGHARVYPDGFALQLPDCERHPDVKPAKRLRVKHDVYACGGLLARVLPLHADLNRAFYFAGESLKQAALADSMDNWAEPFNNVLRVLRAENPNVPVVMRAFKPV